MFTYCYNPPHQLSENYQIIVDGVPSAVFSYDELIQARDILFSNYSKLEGGYFPQYFYKVTHKETSNYIYLLGTNHAIPADLMSPIIKDKIAETSTFITESQMLEEDSKHQEEDKLDPHAEKERIIELLSMNGYQFPIGVFPKWMEKKLSSEAFLFLNVPIILCI